MIQMKDENAKKNEILPKGVVLNNNENVGRP